LPIAIQANAGLPEDRGGELVWPEDPETWADGAATLRDVGVGLIGGCCGTTPEHIAALRRRLAG
jgi:methionine synthase I (cobalamin-dependent)